MGQTTIQPPGERIPQRPMLPRRQRRSLPARFAQAFKSWARDTFSRDQFISGLKSLAWVAPMTVIIWIYAEREQTVNNQAVQFRLEAKNLDPNRVVELRIPNSDGSSIIHAELSGQQTRVERVRGSLVGTPLSIEIPPNLHPGINTLSNLLITNADTFVKDGITVSNLQPSQIDVLIDPIVPAEATVSVPPNLKTIESPFFTPSTVTVRAPKSVLDQAQAGGKKLVVYADIKPGSGTGEQPAVIVPVTFPINNSHISLQPTTVSAVVTVKSPDVTGLLDFVPVHVTAPPDPLWDKYKPDVKAIYRLNVTGAKDAIDLITNPEKEGVKRAILDLSTIKPAINPGNKDQSYTAEVHYDFGTTGVREAADAPKTLDFRLVERKPGTE